MKRFFLLVLMLEILVAGIYGLTRRYDPAAAHIEILLPDMECPAPCWRGIQINDSDAQVHMILDQLPEARDGLGSKEFSADGQHFYTSYVIVSTRSKRILEIMLDVYSLVSVGELLLHLGNPDCVRLAVANDTRLIFFFQDEQLELFTEPLSAPRLDVKTPVRAIYYHPGRPAACKPWRGFTWYTEQR